MPNMNIGKMQVELAQKTRKDIFEYYAANPGCRRTDAAEHLGVHVMTVTNHMKAIRAGWRPSKVAE